MLKYMKYPVNFKTESDYQTLTKLFFCEAIFYSFFLSHILQLTRFT